MSGKKKTPKTDAVAVSITPAEDTPPAPKRKPKASAAEGAIEETRGLVMVCLLVAHNGTGAGSYLYRVPIKEARAMVADGVALIVGKDWPGRRAALLAAGSKLLAHKKASK